MLILASSGFGQNPCFISVSVMTLWSSGKSGAMTLDNAGELIEVTPANNLSIIDTVGTGDAFAAELLLGMLLDWPLSVTMERAQAFASALVSQRGATMQNSGFYQTFKPGISIKLRQKNKRDLRLDR